MEILQTLFLFCLVATASAVTGSGSGSGSASDSGSGSGMDCASAGCSYRCQEDILGEPECYCPTGQRIDPDDPTSTQCETCPGGRWGEDCINECNCGDGNGCDNVDGTCICNSCWTGTNCASPMGSDCLKEFLAIPNKVTDDLQDRYGGSAIPVIPTDTVTGLWAELLESNANIISTSQFTIVDRSDVSQGPLAKLICSLDFTVDRPEANQALGNIRSAINLGTYRATLVIQELTNVAHVTLNAGTSYP